MFKVLTFEICSKLENLTKVIKGLFLVFRRKTHYKSRVNSACVCEEFLQGYYMWYIYNIVSSLLIKVHNV